MWGGGHGGTVGGGEVKQGGRTQTGDEYTHT